MSRSRLPLTALCAAASLLLAGCGSGAITRAEYIVRADAICQHTLAEVRAGAGLAATPALVDRRARALAALPRPLADRPLLRRFLAAEGAEVGLWRRLVAASRHPTEPQPIDRALTAIAASPAPELARVYGMRVCGAARGTIGSR